MKFKKSMSISYVLFPIIMLTIGLQVFFLSYTARHSNNMKKVLQEAAYSGALAGSLVLDLNNFENGIEVGGDINKYPIDNVSGNPVIFMKQKAKAVIKTGDGNLTTLISDKDILNIKRITPISYNTAIATSENIAAKEAINVAEKFLNDALRDVHDINGNSVYDRDSYAISVYFERDNLSYNGVPDTKTTGPYNKITVTVSLKYKPIMYAKAFKADGEVIDDNDVRIPIYGTSSARTKTIL